jgi:uncharacterized membrane protein
MSALQARGSAYTVCALSVAHRPAPTALLLCQVVEKRTPFGAVLSAPLVAMIAALGLAMLGVIPTAAPTYDAVWVYLMPLAAALSLLESDLRR